MAKERACRLQSLCGPELIDFLVAEKKKQQSMKLLPVEPLYHPYPFISEAVAQRDIKIADNHLNPELTF